jgi:ADP-ribosylglycohydrolase
MNTKIDRARGSLLGQFAGDSLGSLVEFRTPEEIRREYPEGVRELVDGGAWGTIAGQPTDDSEMALMLARMLTELGSYDAETALRAYRSWFESEPFDCGMTITAALSGRPNLESQANGAMMRVAPLGIFGSNYSREQVALWADQDAALTHPHPVCRQANALFAAAIARAVRGHCRPCR